MKETISEKIERIAKRRGFFWQSSEIYGGLAGFYEYGHLGTLIKKRWEKLWRDYFLSLDDNFYEIESSDIMHENVFIASGHVKSFVDPIVKCKKCGNTERADYIIEDKLKEKFEGVSPKELTKLIRKHKIKCSKCKGDFKEVGILNMMFPLGIGTGDSTKAYLRPETAQGPYINFKREFDALRKKLPLGLAIIGRAYRNEISPRNVLIRMREFTQAELQIFFNPKEIDKHPNFGEVKNYKLRLFLVNNRKNKKIIEISCKDVLKKTALPKFYVYYMAKIQQFYLDVLKIPKKKFRFKELSDEEKAFYNKYHFDIELDFQDFGFTEVAGIHYRTDHDLSGHQKISKEKMEVNVDGEKFIPHVLELSFGVDRNLYALFDLFYNEEKERALFRFPRRLAPYDAAVFPLVNKDKLPEKAREIFDILKEKGFVVFYDSSGSVGRRYRRMDEAGTSTCITIDYDSLKKQDLTLRDRDSMKQVRVKIKNLPETLDKFLDGTELKKLGKIIK